MQKGTISVQTENIFPIIKKFLYSDQEIFLRELISNAVDATTKLRALSYRGDFAGDISDTTIEVILNKEAKTLTIRDKGIGMSEEEVVKYLNQIAFSSASEWLEKYKNEANLIGHFGLGFYSAFMVAEKVEVMTKSWKEEAPAVVWTCTGSPEYSIETTDKKDRGTEIILHISEDAREYLEADRIEELLKKHCKFLPVPIKFGTRTQMVENEGTEKSEPETEEVDNIINNTNPAWKRSPGELIEDDYKNFYRELYPFGTDPMFWIHLNIDYPFNLTGILYFPKVSNNFEVQKNKIQLYSNQVYVTDDVKEIVPDWLTLLHGVIDSPDIPLNVSRSYLQSDSNVRKITGYITKKVADKLFDLFKEDRQIFESKWNDLSIFIKYGILSDEKFYEKAIAFLLIKNTDGKYFTLEEYKDTVQLSQKDKHGKVILLYSNNPIEHASYMQTAKNAGYDILVLDQFIDNHIIQQLEYKNQDILFRRVDSDTVDHLIEKEEKRASVLSEKEEQQVKEIFRTIIPEKEASVILKALSPEEAPVQITRPEFMRRMKEMQALNGMSLDFLPDSYNVVINSNHPLVAQKLIGIANAAQQKDLASYLYDLAKLNQNLLKGNELKAFVEKTLNMVK